MRPLIPLNVDPPQHSKYRKLLDPLFAPKRMDEQEEDITRRVNGFIDTFIDRGECNFTEEFAELFPSSVFLGLMGLPEDEMRMFLDMRDGILHPEKKDPDAIVDVDARMKVMNATGEQIYEYFGNLVDERTKQPADDIITRFVAAEIDGEKLTRDDILDICFLFLIAGLDTVSDTLTCSYAFLAQHPEHRQMIVDDPSIIPIAVEELLRWESPVAGGVPRLATCPVELPSGTRVDEGTAVVPNYGAANMDPATFGDPMEVRFDRTDNPHIAFGGGVHRCLGSHLARRELRVTLREWHRRIPEYRHQAGPRGARVSARAAARQGPHAHLGVSNDARRRLLRPVRLRDRRRPVPGVEADARRGAALLQREVRLLRGEPVRRRRAVLGRLAHLPLGPGLGARDDQGGRRDPARQHPLRGPAHPRHPPRRCSRGCSRRGGSPTIEPKVRAFCAASLDPLVGAGGFDFIGDLGAQMPMRTIGMLLGIPEQDQEALRDRLDDGLRLKEGAPPDPNDTLVSLADEAFAEYIDWRAEHPSDDLMTELLNAEFEDDTGVTRDAHAARRSSATSVCSPAPATRRRRA